MENEVKKTEPVGIIGFILSFFFPFIALIVSIIGINKAKKNDSSKGFAVAGLIISIILLLIRALLIFLLFVLIRVSSSSMDVPNFYNEIYERAKSCEKAFGNYYNCKYEKNGVDFNGICHKDHIPEAFKEEETTDYKWIENAASKYYISNYDGIISTIKSTRALDDIIVVINEETENFKVYDDKDTLKGVDSQGKIVDLTEYSINMN